MDGAALDSQEWNELAESLSAPVPDAAVSLRAGNSGSNFKYIDGATAVELANHILGFDGWSSEIIRCEPDFIERENDRWQVMFSAVVRVRLLKGTRAYHDGLGCGIAMQRQKLDAVEHAKKSAITDAMKRSLRQFGAALGNIIDKQALHTLKQQMGPRQHHSSTQKGAAPSGGVKSLPPPIAVSSTPDPVQTAPPSAAPATVSVPPPIPAGSIPVPSVNSAPPVPVPVAVPTPVPGPSPAPVPAPPTSTHVSAPVSSHNQGQTPGPPVPPALGTSFTFGQSDPPSVGISAIPPQPPYAHPPALPQPAPLPQVPAANNSRSLFRAT